MFDWLEADRLGACANPAYGEAVVARLRDGRIDVLVNLHERPDPSSLLAHLGAEAVHLPVADFTAPSQEQLEHGVAAISAALARGRRVAVHCGGGLGRTGTLLACYLVSTGCAPDQAIERVRAARPGSVETEAQEQAVWRFARRLSESGGG